MAASPQKAALVVTSISPPNAVLKSLAAGAAAHGVPFLIMGDSKSPAKFELPGADFYSLGQQREMTFAYAKVCPERSYTRKNLGYLQAIADGAALIIETDDDNFPHEDFWTPRSQAVTGDFLGGSGWLNAYHYFADGGIYPRGFPLESVRDPRVTDVARGDLRKTHCPIQQGLADDNPDVDAIYRMLMPLPMQFRKERPVILGARRWCPFNSQNTTTFREAFPLLYLPAYCSFRMTDIWRSFVAQRILWTCGWNVAFHSASVHQERNEHNLLRDFEDEVPGYLHNARIAAALEALPLAEGLQNIAANLRGCYEELVRLGVVGAEELTLLGHWLDDLRTLGLV